MSKPKPKPRYKCKLERCTRLICDATGRQAYCSPECYEEAQFLRCVVNAEVMVPAVLN